MERENRQRLQRQSELLAEELGERQQPLVMGQLLLLVALVVVAVRAGGATCGQYCHWGTK